MQDRKKRFHDGEAISAKIVANLIQSAGADEFITFNIHEKMCFRLFDIPTTNISAMGAIAEYIDKKLMKNL